ncbi:hypothetical protein D3C84_779140 [compost metagenome]
MDGSIGQAEDDRRHAGRQTIVPDVDLAAQAGQGVVNGKAIHHITTRAVDVDVELLGIKHPGGLAIRDELLGGNTPVPDHVVDVDLDRGHSPG